MSKLPHVSPSRNNILKQNGMAVVFNSHLFSRVAAPSQLLPSYQLNPLNDTLKNKQSSLEMLQVLDYSGQQPQFIPRRGDGSQTKRHQGPNYLDLPVNQNNRITYHTNVSRIDYGLPDPYLSSANSPRNHSEFPQPSIAQAKMYSQLTRNSVIQSNFKIAPPNVVLPVIKTHRKLPSQDKTYESKLQQQLEKQEKLLQRFIEQWDQQAKEQEKKEKSLIETKIEELHFKTKMMEQTIKMQEEETKKIYEREPKNKNEPNKIKERDSILIKILEKSFVEKIKEIKPKEEFTKEDSPSRSKKRRHVKRDKNHLSKNQPEVTRPIEESSIEDIPLTLEKLSGSTTQSSQNQPFTLKIIENQSLSNLNDKSPLSCTTKPLLSEEDYTGTPSTYSTKKRRLRVKTIKQKGSKSSQPLSEDLQSPKKSKAKSRLASIAWSMAFPHLLLENVKQKVLVEKQKSLKILNENLNFLHYQIELYILQTAGKQIEEMLQDKRYSFSFVSEKSPNKKVDKDCEALFIHLKNILDKVFTHTKNLSSQAFALLASMFEENSILPNDYFTDFEIKRLQFTCYGKLKLMNPAKSKIMIAGIILRVLVHKIIMHPWEVFNKDPNKFKQDKLLNIGSFVYVLFMEVMKGMGPVFHNNQNSIPLEFRVKPRRILLKATDLNDSEIKMTAQKDPDGEILEGFYAKQQLECFFVNKKKLVSELKSLICGWLDHLYEFSGSKSFLKKKI